MSATESPWPQPTMAQPARYRILVRGHLDPTTVRSLRDLSAENTVDERGAPIAVIRGELPDQAALMGILNALYGFHLPLLSAEFLASEEEA